MRRRARWAQSATIASSSFANTSRTRVVAPPMPRGDAPIVLRGSPRFEPLAMERQLPLFAAGSAPSALGPPSGGERQRGTTACRSGQDATRRRWRSSARRMPCGKKERIQEVFVSWIPSGRVDSNHRPPDPQSGALTRLRYAPMPSAQSTTRPRACHGLPWHSVCAHDSYATQAELCWHAAFASARQSFVPASGNSVECTHAAHSELGVFGGA